ncbi:MAG TPA: hypothetical protein VG498_23680, partial [Terriglobales bacterium]|nr:hypothetical protein [Terriglobales bacterium]
MPTATAALRIHANTFASGRSKRPGAKVTSIIVPEMEIVAGLSTSVQGFAFPLGVEESDDEGAARKLWRAAMIMAHATVANNTARDRILKTRIAGPLLT